MSDIDKAASDVEQVGGMIKQRYNVDFMRGFSARIPMELASKFSAEASSGRSNMYVEPYQCIC